MTAQAVRGTSACPGLDPGLARRSSISVMSDSARIERRVLFLRDGFEDLDEAGDPA